eukprot:gene16528-19643_t
MKVLVTGSAGHLGEALVRTLKNRNYQVLGLDVKASDFTTHVGSITDSAFVKQCMSGVQWVFHTAILHKPHVVTHSLQDFIDTNVSGTLNLLQEASAAGVAAFVFTSSTSVFGDAMVPENGGPAVWVTEELVPVPKNIYGVTKLAAENLCQLFHRNQGLPCIILRTSRFFNEDDDQKGIRERYSNDNSKVNEYLFRRVDIEDAVAAHILAAQRAGKIGFSKYIISAASPFSVSDLAELNENAAAVLQRRLPDYVQVYQNRGWEMFDQIDRVYVSDLAQKELDWKPRYTFGFAIEQLKAGEPAKSPMALLVGTKSYHETTFSEGPYPVDEGR